MDSLNETLRTVLKSSWFVIAAGIWVQCSTGATYDFGIYSQSIKESLGYDQQDLDLISFSKDIGANVGIVAGLLYERFPPWAILAAAAALGFTGNFMTWLSITGKVEVPSLWLMCLYAFLAANSQTFSNTAVVVTSVKIFPRSRGTVVGLLKGCLGLSGAVLVQLYYAAYGSNEKAFPFLTAWLMPVVCLTSMFVIRPMPAVKTGNQKKWLNMFSVIVVTLAAYLLVVIIVQNCISVGRVWKITIFVGIMVVLILPIWVVVKAEIDFRFHTTETNPLLHKTIDEEGLLLYLGKNTEDLRTSQLMDTHEQRTSSAGVRTATHPIRGEDFSLLQAMCSLDFWLLFFASACGMGPGITTINNMSQLGSSLYYTKSEISTLVSLWSIWNFLGRFGGGYISERFFQSTGVARPLFMVIMLAVMAIGHIIIAISFPGSLYIGPILIGISYGAQWSLMPSTASELFGLTSFGAVFNTISVASPLSSYILSVKVMAYLYDLEAEKNTFIRPHSVQPSLLSESSCNGAHCFRLSFIIMAAVCMAGSFISACLFLRTRIFYKEKKLQFEISGHG